MRVMRLEIVPTLVFGLLFSACMDGERDDIKAVSQPIIGGETARVGDYPTTVAISNGGLCTGTLIAPDLVLTAAHCILPSLIGASSQQEVTSRTQVIVDTDNLFGGGGRPYAAAETIPHPNFSVNRLGDDDIGLIRLRTAITDREPTPINRSRDDAKAGTVVTQVGYGASQVGGGGAGRLFAIPEKTSTSCSTFGTSDDKLLCFSQVDGQGKCQGDSGGPSFATIDGIERVVGVTSFGDQTCATFGADTRVDAELDFLYTHAPELQCQADGECNDDCGRGSLPFDEDCSRCTKDTDCDTAEICAEDGLCVPAPFTPGGEGSECSGNGDCASGLCATDDQGGACTSLCSSDEQCLEGFECVEAGAERVCWPEAEDSGGCSIGRDRKAPIGTLLFAVALVLASRRRRRC